MDAQGWATSHAQCAFGGIERNVLSVTVPVYQADQAFEIQLNIMKFLVPIASAITGFISSCISMLVTVWLLDVLPVGKAYFSDTPVHGLTYGEFFATLVIILLFAYAIGLLHGLLFGERYSQVISLTAATPLFIMMLGLAAVTLGMGLIAFPIVVAFGAIVAYGVKRGGQHKHDCHQGSEAG